MILRHNRSTRLVGGLWSRPLGFWQRFRASSWSLTQPAVLAFDRGFIAMPSQNQDLGIARDGLRGRAPRHGNLALRSAIGYWSSGAMLGYGALASCACAFILDDRKCYDIITR